MISLNERCSLLPRHLPLLSAGIHEASWCWFSSIDVEKGLGGERKVVNKGVGGVIEWRQEEREKSRRGLV